MLPILNQLTLVYNQDCDHTVHTHLRLSISVSFNNLLLIYHFSSVNDSLLLCTNVCWHIFLILHVREPV